MTEWCTAHPYMTFWLIVLGLSASIQAIKTYVER